MIEIDPVHEIERVLSTEISHTAQRVMGWMPADVQVHFREDTVVYLMEGDGLPGPDAALIQAMEEAVEQIMLRTLGRAVASPIGRTRVSHDSLLVVVRLI